MPAAPEKSPSAASTVSRRRALFGALTAVAASVGYEVATAPQADAGSGDPLVAGSDNFAATRTNLYCSSGDSAGLYVTANVLDADQEGAIWGQAQHADGVFGDSSDRNGVHGQGGLNGVYGWGGGNGVFGETSNPGASGVYGQNNEAGYGVAGRADAGVALFATSTGGTALLVNGRAHFSRSSIAHIPAGSTSKRVSVTGMTPNNMVLATMQTHVSGTWVEAAVPNTDHVTIHLNRAAPTGGVNVGWIELA